MNYIYIALTIAFTVFGQLAIKSQVAAAGALPAAGGDKLMFLIRLLLNPMIIAAFASAFLASICWMGAMTKFPLSQAYPFMALNFVIVLALSAWMFNEPISAMRWLGIALICVGTFIAAQE
jgi:multidrug transporter EmrE-like cation transporter